MNKVNISKRLGLNTMSRWAASFAQMALGIFLTPILILELGTEAYGLCALATTINTLALIAEFRIRDSLTRELTAALTSGACDRASRLASTSVAVYGVLGSLAAALCIVSAPSLAIWFKVSPAMYNEAVDLIRYYGGWSTLIAFASPIYSSTLMARNRYDLINYVDLTIALVRGMTLIAVLLISDHDLMAWSIVMLSFNTLAVFVLRRLALHVVPEIERKPSLVDFRLFRSVLVLSGALSLLRLSRMLRDTLNPIILTSFLGPTAVAFYRPGASLVRMAGPFAKAVREQLQPLTTQAHVSGQAAQLQQLLVVGTRFTILLATPIYIVLFVFAQAIIEVWVGHALGPGAVITAQVLMLLAVVETAICFGGSQFPVLLGANAIGFVVKLQLVLSILNLIISVVLVGYTSLGVLGVVVATVLFEVVRQPPIAIYTSRIVGLPVRDYLYAAYARPFAVMIAVAAMAWALQAFLQPHSLLRLLVAVGLTVCWWAAFSWWVGLEPADRIRIRHLAGVGWTSIIRASFS